jgi:hypothetical protein
MTPKILTLVAAAGVAGLLAMPNPATANEQRPDGVRNAEVTEFSAQRRYRRHYVRRYYVPPRVYYGPPYYYPYGAYAYYPYRYRYYRPGPHIHVGPRGFSFGFGY